MSFFTIWAVQSAVTRESLQALSRKSVYFVISKMISHFPYFMTTVYFWTVIYVFRTSIYAVFYAVFYAVYAVFKQTLLIKWLTLFLLKIYHQSVSQTYKL